MTIIQTLEGRSLEYDSKEITIQQALTIYARSHVDFERQRWGGVFYHRDTGTAVSRGAGWQIKKGKEYIQNVFLNLNLNQVIAVDLQSVIAYCNRNNLLTDVEYFIKISNKTVPNDEMGKDSLSPKYLIEDAHNTLSYLTAYVDGRFSVKVPGEKKDKKFTALTEELQQYFLSQKISIKMVTGATVDLLHKNIISVNSSLAWSRQDCRNAYSGGNIASFVRKCADIEEKNGTRNAFSCVFSKAEAEKRETDKLFAQHLKYEHAKITGWEGKQIVDSELDDFYYDVKNINETLQNRSFNILSTMENMLKDQSSRSMKKGRWSNMWFFITNCIEGIYKVKDSKILLDEYLNFLWNIEKKEAVKGWTEFEKETESFENASYFFYCRKRVAKERDSEGVKTGTKKTVMTWELRENKIKEWFGTVEKDLIKSGAISKIRGYRDRFSHKHKRMAYIEGKVDSGISPSDVFSKTTPIEADHPKSVDKGGPTSQENIQLMTRKNNRVKGAKIL